MHDEIIKQIQMTYDEQCVYLQQKYGLPKRDYFANESCKTKVKTNSRTAEGLFIHHNAEAYGNGGNLGEPHMAKLSPFEYQKRENLSYCNYLEHLILHLKINAKERSVFEWPFELQQFFHSWGFFFICSEMNALYRNSGSEVTWRNNCYQTIREYFNDYVSILKGTLCFLDDNYIGPRIISIEEGVKLCVDLPRIREQPDGGENRKSYYYDRHYFVVQKVNYTDGTAVVKFDDGSQGIRELGKLKNRFDFEYQKNRYIQLMSDLGSEPVWSELEQLLKEEYTEEEKLIARSLKMEFAEK